MKTNVMAGQVSLFGLDSPYGKTCLMCFNA